jgi:hypothetical protein
MLSVSNLFLKQQENFNISVFIFYIFKWFYAFNKKEMSYEDCVVRITKLLQAVEEEEETLWGKNSESEDELEICDYQSGTEQSGDESEDGVSEYIQEEIQESPQEKRKRCEVCPLSAKNKYVKTIVQLFANFAFHKLLFVFHAVNGVKSFNG